VNILGFRPNLVTAVNNNPLTSFVELYMADGAVEGALSVRPAPNQVIGNILLENNSIPAQVVQPASGKPYYRFELVRGGKYWVEDTSLFTLWDRDFTVPDSGQVLLSDLVQGLGSN